MRNTNDFGGNIYLSADIQMYIMKTWYIAWGLMKIRGNMSIQSMILRQGIGCVYGFEGGKAYFRRTRMAYERNNIFVAIKRFAKKCKLDFEGKVYVELYAVYLLE